MTNVQINSLLQQWSEDTQVQLIHTHISWVILTKAFAFKVKKPLSFSFLDYSTLAVRKHYCEQELYLNRRLAPDMYLDVLPIVQQGDQYLINANAGTVIDYTLKMNRMDDAKQMNRLLLSGGVTLNHIDRLVDQVVTFHRNAEVIREDFDPKSWQRTFNDIAVMLPLFQKLKLNESISKIKEGIALSDQFLKTYGHHFSWRQQNGWVIDGHGDLHAKNIFLTSPLVIFDCIEFSKELRVLDVLNEIAFFCMDMDAFDRTDLGNRFLQRFTSSIPCLNSALDRLLFIYFKLYRSNIRLKVNGLRLVQNENDTNCLNQIRRYTHLFSTYMGQLRYAGGL
ncbi:MAG: hypothetical protein HRU40_04910 [Saprospiraceae bacterium]|nr:hypothetical protein [Saprospiraceae bacterium]